MTAIARQGEELDNPILMQIGPIAYVKYHYDGFFTINASTYKDLAAIPHRVAPPGG
jgi:hypothetical protein